MIIGHGSTFGVRLELGLLQHTWECTGPCEKNNVPFAEGVWNTSMFVGGRVKFVRVVLF